MNIPLHQPLEIIQRSMAAKFCDHILSSIFKHNARNIAYTGQSDSQLHVHSCGDYDYVQMYLAFFLHSIHSYPGDVQDSARYKIESLNWYLLPCCKSCFKKGFIAVLIQWIQNPGQTRSWGLGDWWPSDSVWYLSLMAFHELWFNNCLFSDLYLKLTWRTCTWTSTLLIASAGKMQGETFFISAWAMVSDLIGEGSLHGLWAETRKLILQEKHDQSSFVLKTSQRTCKQYGLSFNNVSGLLLIKGFTLNARKSSELGFWYKYSLPTWIFKGVRWDSISS